MDSIVEVYAQDWQFDHSLRLMLPVIEEGCMDAANSPAIAYLPTVDVLDGFQPWPESDASPTSVLAEGSEKQWEMHRRVLTIDVDARRGMLGYATWLTRGTLSLLGGMPLVVREQGHDLGTRIWPASWLHRSWALANPDYFAPSAHVLEMGAGCGLLGLSVAAAHGVQVSVSDFCAYSDKRSPLHNLAYNAAANRVAVAARGGSVQVLELDWTAPESPRSWHAEVDAFPESLDQGLTSIRVAVAPCALQPADVVLATEVLYDRRAEACFARALTHWLARGGSCFLLNNAGRTALARFTETCTECGLQVERLPDIDGSRLFDVTSIIPPPWDDVSQFTFMRITWAI